MILQLSATERITVLDAGPAALLVEVRYGPHGQPPPRHLHPAQHEEFEILAGRLMVERDGESGPRSAGESFAVPAGTVHRMWNPFDEPITARWTTAPAGRTLAMWQEIDALHRNGREPGKLALGRVVARYDDGFRLAGPAGRLLALLPLLPHGGRSTSSP